MNDEFDRILEEIEELNFEEYEAIENGDKVKAEEINKKISRRLDILFGA